MNEQLRVESLEEFKLRIAAYVLNLTRSQLQQDHA